MQHYECMVPAATAFYTPRARGWRPPTPCKSGGDGLGLGANAGDDRSLDPGQLDLTVSTATKVLAVDVRPADAPRARIFLLRPPGTVFCFGFNANKKVSPG